MFEGASAKSAVHNVVRIIQALGDDIGDLCAKCIGESCTNGQAFGLGLEAARACVDAASERVARFRVAQEDTCWNHQLEELLGGALSEQARGRVSSQSTTSPCDLFAARPTAASSWVVSSGLSSSSVVSWSNRVAQRAR